MTVLPVEKQKKFDCTYPIICVCIVVNLTLIVLSIFQANIFLTEFESSRPKHLKLLEEGIEIFVKNTERLETTYQILKNKLTNSNRDLQTLYDYLSEQHFPTDTQRLSLEELNNDIEEFQKVVDELKNNVKLIKMTSYLLMLHPRINKMDATDNHKDEYENLKGNSVHNTTNNKSSDDFNSIRYRGKAFGSASGSELDFNEEVIFIDQSYLSADPFDEDDSNSKALFPQTKKFRLFGNPVNWTEALKRCENQGLQLASINSPAEQTAVEHLLRSNEHLLRGDGSKSADVWTAGNDLGVSRKFVWATTGSRVTYSNWNSGEPNNAWSENEKEQEHCLSLVYAFNYRWNDSLCSKRKYFICEVGD